MAGKAAAVLGVLAPEQGIQHLDVLIRDRAGKVLSRLAPPLRPAFHIDDETRPAVPVQPEHARAPPEDLLAFHWSPDRRRSPKAITEAAEPQPSLGGLRFSRRCWIVRLGIIGTIQRYYSLRL